jgi:hypothetical protein
MIWITAFEKQLFNAGRIAIVFLKKRLKVVKIRRSKLEVRR